MSHPAGLPDLFLDRSLGRIEVPRRLRLAGLRLVTLAEHYGVPTDETIADVVWLTEVGRRGWVALLKDEAIGRRPAERAAIRDHAVRCFCLTRQDLSAEEMAVRFLSNLDSIVAACSRPGPFIYAVHARQLRQVPLR